jgi:hypothetical protein
LVLFFFNAPFSLLHKQTNKRVLVLFIVLVCINFNNREPEVKKGRPHTVQGKPRPDDHDDDHNQNLNVIPAVPAAAVTKAGKMKGNSIGNDDTCSSVDGKESKRVRLTGAEYAQQRHDKQLLARQHAFDDNHDPYFSDLSTGTTSSKKVSSSMTVSPNVPLKDRWWSLKNDIPLFDQCYSQPLLELMSSSMALVYGGFTVVPINGRYDVKCIVSLARPTLTSSLYLPRPDPTISFKSRRNGWSPPLTARLKSLSEVSNTMTSHSQAANIAMIPKRVETKAVHVASSIMSLNTDESKVSSSHSSSSSSSRQASSNVPSKLSSSSSARASTWSSMVGTHKVLRDPASVVSANTEMRCMRTYDDGSESCDIPSYIIQQLLHTLSTIDYSNLDVRFASHWWRQYDYHRMIVIRVPEPPQVAMAPAAGTLPYIADLPDYYNQTPIRLKRVMTVSLLTWLYHIHDGIARAIKRDQHRSPPPPTSTKEWSMNPLTGTVHLKWKHHQPVELVTHHKPSLSSLRREWLGNHQPIFIHAMLPFYRRSLSWLPFVQLFEQ